MENTWDPSLKSPIEKLCECGHYKHHHSDDYNKERCLREGGADGCKRFTQMDNITYVVWYRGKKWQE